MTTTEGPPQPRVKNDVDGGLILKSSPSKITSSLSVSGYKGNKSCKSGKDVSDSTLPPVARGSGSMDNTAPYLQSWTALRTEGRGTSLTSNLVIMNSFATATKSQPIIAPKHQQNCRECLHFVHIHQHGSVLITEMWRSIFSSTIQNGKQNISRVTPFPQSQ